MFVRRRPVLAGALVGTAVARSHIKSAENRRRQDQLEGQVAVANERALQAQKEAENAKNAANLAVQSQQPVATADSDVTIQVTVPPGIASGQSFKVSHGGVMYSVVCPAGVTAGQTLLIRVPRSPVVSTSAVALPAEPVEEKKASLGKELFRQTLESANEQTVLPKCVLTKDHLINEQDPSMRAHNIISGSQGTVVTLLSGDLTSGLGGVYKDYVEVELPTGRRGKLSRFVLAPAPDIVALPPPAIG